MKQVILTEEELNAIIDWHLEQKRVAMNNEDQQLAEGHRKRAMQIVESVKEVNPS